MREDGDRGRRGSGRKGEGGKGEEGRKGGIRRRLNVGVMVCLLMTRDPIAMEEVRATGK